MEQVLRVGHHLPQGGGDPLHFGVQVVPDAGLDGVRVADREHFHPAGLSVAVQPPDPLVEPHRIPRQVDVDQAGAVGLEVDALSPGLGRDEEPHLPAREPLGRPLAGLHRGAGAGAVVHLVRPLVAVDEGGRVAAEPLQQPGQKEGLGRLVLGEEQHRPAGKRAVDQFEDLVDLGLVGDGVGRHEKLPQPRQFVVHQPQLGGHSHRLLLQGVDLVVVVRVHLAAEFGQLVLDLPERASCPPVIRSSRPRTARRMTVNGVSASTGGGGSRRSARCSATRRWNFSRDSGESYAPR